MKNLSLRIKVTLLTATVLFISVILLTLSASYNVETQFSDIILSADQIQDSEDNTLSPIYMNRIDPISEAKKQFNLIGIATSFIILCLGILSVYLIINKAFKPLDKLNKQILLITENNLDEHILGVTTSDEIGSLCNSFNLMLDRLNNSFNVQKQFSAHVAHEFKTPISIIKSNIQVLNLEDEPSTADYKEAVDAIDKYINRLSYVVDDLLKLCDERAVFEKDDILVEEMLVSIVNDLDFMIKSKNLKINLNCDTVYVYGNDSLLYQAFYNLIENAIKYNKNNGEINIVAEIKESIGIISISDTGIGIPKEELEKIFMPFYRISKSRSRKTGGAGLGLSIVKSILEKHGFTISVNSKTNIGSTFEIKFFCKY